jgi:hypothetical protein
MPKPPPPPPPRSGHPRKTARRAVINTALNKVAQRLREDQPQLSAADARDFARIILTRKGVTLGKKGNIYFNGKGYNPAAFAKSTLAQRATGLLAQQRNEKALLGSPAYMQALAELGLQRDESTAGLADQRHQSLIQFGDPTFAGSDAQTASAAAANPYSTTRLMGIANTNQIGSIRNQANRLGTYYGGGLQSGLNQQQFAYGGQVQDATTKLQNLLSSINEQEGLANQAYNVGLAGAKTDAYNQMLASGYTAAAAPNWHPGTFAVRGFGRAPVPTRHPGLPPVAVGPGNHPIVGPPPPQRPLRKRF